MKTCLVVDDSGIIRTVAKKIVEELGFSVEEAANGQIALDTCKNGLPDCVLLDWNMPVMTGIEFLVELRKIPNGNVPIVIFCTTENNLENIKEALEKGANEYVMKPFDADILRTKFMQTGLLES